MRLELLIEHHLGRVEARSRKRVSNSHFDGVVVLLGMALTNRFHGDLNVDGLVLVERGAEVEHGGGGFRVGGVVVVELGVSSEVVESFALGLCLADGVDSGSRVEHCRVQGIDGAGENHGFLFSGVLA